MAEPFKIVECPRDAWQGLPRVIPTAEKVAYLSALIEAGFRHLDAVSFVSPKWVPQMADSEQVLEGLFTGDPARGKKGRPRRPAGVGPSAGGSAGRPRGGKRAHAPAEVEIIGIVLNERGLKRALSAPGVTTIGYPYSVSSTFQRQNANQTPEVARELVLELRERAEQALRGLVVYVSMAFGNPYGDPYSPRAVAEATDWLRQNGVRAVSLADTVGTATAEDVRRVFEAVQPHAAGIELGLHLHTRPDAAEEKVRAAHAAGCRRLDGALGGLGGCPFADDRLVGNLPTERALAALETMGVECAPRPAALAEPLSLTREIERRYGHTEEGP